jgi:hypothetical protein
MTACYSAFLRESINSKKMKLKDLKKKLDKMSKEQLNQDLIVVACNKTLSGLGDAKTSNSHLIWTGDDDPCELRTKTELVGEGYDKEEIAEMEVMVERGGFYIELP